MQRLCVCWRSCCCCGGVVCVQEESCAAPCPDVKPALPGARLPRHASCLCLACASNPSSRHLLLCAPRGAALHTRRCWALCSAWPRGGRAWWWLTACPPRPSATKSWCWSRQGLRDPGCCCRCCCCCAACRLWLRCAQGRWSRGVARRALTEAARLQPQQLPLPRAAPAAVPAAPCAVVVTSPCRPPISLPAGPGGGERVAPGAAGTGRKVRGAVVPPAGARG